MPFADKKTWEKTRTSVCKGSGVGAACDAWKKHCGDPDKVADDPKKASDAIKTINEMYEALKTARGKLAKAKKGDKQADATKDLLDDWEKQTRAYQDKLNGAVVKAAAEELKGKIEKARQQFLQVFAETERQLNEVIPEILDKAEAFIKQGDARSAETQLQNANGKIKYCVTALNKADAVRNAEKDNGLTPGKLSLKDFASRLNPCKNTLKALYKRVEGLEEQLDDMGEGADPVPSKSDPAYKKKFDEVMKAYKEVLKEIDSFIGEAKELHKKCQSFNGNPLLEKNPDGMVKVADKLNKDFIKVKADSAKALHDIRESTGKVVKMRVAAKFEEQDVKAFGPLMTRGMTLNGRIIALSNKGVDELREGLDTIINGANQAAAKDAKALLAKL